MSNEILKRLEELIEKAICYEGPWPTAAIARDYAALTVYCDLGGCLAIRKDGEVISIPDDPHGSVGVERDVALRNLAFIKAAKLYPELISLVPSRPPDALICSDCAGTGVNPITAHPGFENIICRCGGAGWLPAP